MKFIYSLLCCVFIISSCSDSSQLFNQKDIEKITNQNPSQSILVIDSLILNHSLDENQKNFLLYTKGRAYFKLKQYKKAILYFETLEKKFNQKENKSYLAKTYYQLGSLNIIINKKEIANEFFLKALMISRELKDVQLEANILSQLSHVLYLYKDYEGSMEYVMKALAIEKKANDTNAISELYNNIAVLYKNQNKLNKAIEYNTKSLVLNELLNNKSAIANSYNNLGQVYRLKKEIDKAELYYKKAIKTIEQSKKPYSSPYSNLAELYFDQNKLNESKKQFNKALTYAKGKSQIQKDIYNILFLISIQENDYQQSILYKEKIEELKEKIEHTKQEELLNLVKSQYELSQKESELNQIQSLNNKNRIILLSVICLGLLLSLFWYQKTKNTKLKLKEEKLRLEQKVLRSQMNPHFIFNALSAIQNSLLDNDVIKSASYLSKFAKLIRQNFDFINQNKITLSEEIDALKNYMDTQKIRFSNNFEYEINIDKNVSVHTVEIPPILLQPFVENSIEHGFKNKKEKGKILITITKDKNRIHYEIKDNGKGITEKMKDTKEHALDIFKKRLILIGNKDEQTLKIISDNYGTTIQFSLVET